MLQQAIINDRPVELWIPESVRTDSPLLLAHDGQNCFDGTHSISGRGWELDVAAQRAADRLGVPAPVIVAPWNVGRKRVMEYGSESVFRRNEDWARAYRALHGDTAEPCGNAYIDWCADQVLPWAGSTAGITISRERTAVLGSSMGGLASLAALSRRPDKYECALCVSTHWSSGDMAFVDACIDDLPEPGQHRLWFDHGDQGLDATYSPFQDRADSRLEAHRWQGRFERRSFPGADHTEVDWAARAHLVIEYWLSGISTH